MIYSFKRMIHNLKKNVVVYLLFVIQFAVGMLILCSTLNVLISLQKDLKAKQEEITADHTIEIIANMVREEETDEPYFLKGSMPVSSDVYLKLSEKYKEDVTFQYAVDMQGEATWIWAPDGKMEIDLLEYNIWFVNDELFQDYFGMSMERNTMYAGENAYQKLEKLKEYAGDPEQYLLDSSADAIIRVENGEYMVAGKDVYTLAVMPESEKKVITPSVPYLRERFSDSLSDCVFIPISSLPVYEEFYESLDLGDDIVKAAHLCLLKAQYKNPDFKPEIMSEMLTFLMKESHASERSDTTMEFTLDEKQLEQQRMAETVKYSMNNYLIMSVSILLVVMFGTTGLFLIFLYRRKKNMAVALAYGATRRRLFFELFMEIFVITGLGAALGLWALRFTSEFFKTFYLNTSFQIGCVVIAFIIAAFTALFTAVLSFVGVGEISPAKLLKEL